MLTCVYLHIPIRPHVYLWLAYMVTYTVLLALMPCTWISYIWDQVIVLLIILSINIIITLINIIILPIQIIDPEFDLENIEQPDNRLINAFYQVSLPFLSSSSSELQSL